jgi:predicted anti-sigma-YlaC factor YlaD
MDCTACREAISAQLDNEAEGLDADRVQAHLAHCAACQAYWAQANRLHRSLRLRPAEPVHDLTATILARIGHAAGGRERWQLQLRVGLAVVAVLGGVVALPTLLLGEGADAPMHVARELGSFQVALAVGFLAIAWRPTRAAGMLPVVAVLTLCPALIGVLDLIAGRAQAPTESQHLLQLVGLVLVWLLARPVDRFRPAVSR